MDSGTITTLKGEARGDVILPGDAAYEQARRVYNAMIDKRRAVVVTCVDSGDVMPVCRFIP